MTKVPFAPESYKDLWEERGRLTRRIETEIGLSAVQAEGLALRVEAIETRLCQRACPTLEDITIKVLWLCELIEDQGSVAHAMARTTIKSLLQDFAALGAAPDEPRGIVVPVDRTAGGQSFR